MTKSSQFNYQLALKSLTGLHFINVARVLNKMIEQMIIAAPYQHICLKVL